MIEQEFVVTEAVAEGVIDPGEKISFEEYLRRFTAYEGGHTEWLAGEVAIYPMTNNLQHNELVAFLTSLLRFMISIHKLGRVILAGVPMKYSDTMPAREPDVMVILRDHLDRLRPTYIDGIADIVIEVISPESDARDRGAKFIEYEAAGVPEYWLFDPIRQEAIIYARGQDDRYHPFPLDAQGRLTSTLLPGFALDPHILWGETLPDGMALVALVQAMDGDQNG